MCAHEVYNIISHCLFLVHEKLPNQGMIVDVVNDIGQINGTKCHTTRENWHNNH